MEAESGWHTLGLLRRLLHLGRKINHEIRTRGNHDGGNRGNHDGDRRGNDGGGRGGGNRVHFDDRSNGTSCRTDIVTHLPRFEGSSQLQTKLKALALYFIDVYATKVR